MTTDVVRSQDAGRLAVRSVPGFSKPSRPGYLTSENGQTSSTQARSVASSRPSRPPSTPIVRTHGKAVYRLTVGLVHQEAVEWG